jgi:hypothetical protein
MTGFFAIALGVLLVKWFHVKIYKVVGATAAVYYPFRQDGF